MRFSKLIAAGAALAACLLVPTTAQAAPPLSVAGTGEFAIWDGTNFTGLSASMVTHTPNYLGLVYAGTNVRLTNTASSAANYAPNFRVHAYREDDLRACDLTAPLLEFLRKGQTNAQASWFYANLADKGFNNDIGGHCFR